LPRRKPLSRAETPDVRGDHAGLTPKPVAADRVEQVRPVPTLMVPAGQEHGFIGIKATPITIMPGLACGERRVLERPRHGAPTAADLLRDGVQGPVLLMIRPNLVIMGPPPGAPLAGQSCRHAG
jgi:hypothetical protein